MKGKSAQRNCHLGHPGDFDHSFYLTFISLLFQGVIENLLKPVLNLLLTMEISGGQKNTEAAER